MRVLTAGDDKFYHCMVGLAESVRKYYGKPLILYDLGLTDEQRESIDAEIVDIDLEVDYGGYVQHDGASFIKTTHKPCCIRHYFQTNNEPLIYADGDCLFLQRVELHGFDLGVTLKPRRKRNLDNYFNGILNAGVIFFNRYPEQLIERWIEGCSRPDVTDQMVLAQLLSETIDWKGENKLYDWHGLSVKTLQVEEYNDYSLRTGKILHFKGKRHEGPMYQELLQALRCGQDPYAVFRKSKASGGGGIFSRLFRWR